MPDASGLDDGFAASRAWAVRVLLPCRLDGLGAFGRLGHGPDACGQSRAHAADLAQERVLVALAVFDVGQHAFPLGGEFHVLEFRGDDLDEEASLGSGAQLLSFAFHVAGVDELFDDVRPGGRRADAAGMGFVVVQGGLEVLVLDVAAGMFHGGEQGRFGERLRRPGLALIESAAALRDGRQDGALFEAGRDGVAAFVLSGIVLLPGVAFDGLPARRHRLVGTAGERQFRFLGSRRVHVAFQPAGIRQGLHDGHVVHVVVGHGLPHAASNADEHEAFVVAEFVECRLVCLHGGKDGGVAGDLRVVHGQFETRPFRFRGRFDEAIDEPVAFGEAAQRVQVVVRDVLRVGTRIRRQFFLIQGLQGGEGAGGGQSVQSRHVLLQAGQVVQARRGDMLAFAFGRFDLEGEVGGVRQDEHALREVVVFDAFAGQRPSAHRRLDAPEGFRHVAGDLHVTVHDHRQGRGLHAAYGQAAVVGDRVGPGGVHADQPVGLGARVGRVAQAPIVALRPHRPPRVAYGVLVQRGDPQAQ